MSKTAAVLKSLGVHCAAHNLYSFNLILSTRITMYCRGSSAGEWLGTWVSVGAKPINEIFLPA